MGTRGDLVRGYSRQQVYLEMSGPEATQGSPADPKQKKLTRNLEILIDRYVSYPNHEFTNPYGRQSQEHQALLRVAARG